MEEDNDDLEEQGSGENLPQEQSNKSSKDNQSQLSKEASKKIQEQVSKSMTKNAAKQTLIKALLPVLTWVLVFILILIIIIGIVMFFITMPGMVMDKIKDLAKAIGDALASFFGESTTEQVEDQEIYDVLDYLEQMGYDLKGYGFLTEYEEESDVEENQYFDKEASVIRNESDDKIAKAKSDYIYNYLVSENYIYTIQNFNTSTDHWWQALGDHIGSLFSDSLKNREGMLVIYHEGSGGVGYTSTNAYDAWERGSIKADPEKKTLVIKRGWSNNAMSFNLDGWTGRYGIPIDFLLSIHLATMMPDLAYDISTSFKTEVNIILHELNNAYADAAFDTENDNNETGSRYITYDDFHTEASTGITQGLNGWKINKKEAKSIMKKFGIKSQTEGKYACTGHNDPTITEWPSSVQGKNSTDAFDDVSESQIMVNNDCLEADMDDRNYKDWTSLYEYLYDCGSGENDDSHVFKSVGNGAHGAAFDVDKLKTMVNNLREAWDKCNELSGDVQENPFNVSSGPKFAALKVLDDYDELDFDSLVDSGKDECFVEIGTWTQVISENADDPELDEEIEYTLELRMRGTGVTLYDNWEYSLIVYRDMTDAELEEAGIDLSTSESDLCSNNTSEKVCKHCLNYVKAIYKQLKKAHDSDFDTYTPYISKVTNHWYRDTYFVVKPSENINFVKNDFDYEAITKERWTLYETDDEGNFVYYEIDDNGNYIKNADGSLKKYEGNVISGEQQTGNNETTIIASVGEDGTKIAKKAITFKIDDVDEDNVVAAEDYNWQKLSNNAWSAYAEDTNTSTTDWEPVYPDANSDIKNHIYSKITSSGNVKQTGEGLRTETNAEIKKMFLNNKYFRYDGSTETAEIITKLREENNIPYGHLSESDLEKTAIIDNKKQKVSDYAGEVSLNQDSLNAFSMLENEHTLDADYIYRDFKELIVELGYFEKEELTDETPRLLEFLVPEIGSKGYPNRAIDKNENEKGTMIHSKGDIDAYKRQTLVSLISEAIETASDEEETQQDSNVTQTQSSLNTSVSGIEQVEEEEHFTSLGSIDTDSSSTSLLSLEEWWEETQKMFDVYKSQSWVYGHSNSGTTFETAVALDVDCSIGASWMLQKLGALQDNHTFSSALGDSGALDESNVCAQDLLNAGAEVIVPTGSTNFSTAANGGELEPGDVIFYDGHVSIYSGDSYEGAGVTYCWDTGSTTGIQNGGPRDTSWEDRPIKLILRLPLGQSLGEGNLYEGYLGNEAVVSPVTGILLEYDTYDGEEFDTVSGEKYRTNIDLKYKTGIISDTEEETADGTQANTPETSQPEEPQVATNLPAEKVGYAKILVLDKENYKKLEEGIINQTRWNSSLLSSGGTYTEIENLTDEKVNDKDDPWTDMDRTLYGYKEFAENYEEFGIAGNTIYIEGFSCELPDEEFDNTNIEDQKTKSPSGEEISGDDFENIKPESFTDGTLNDDAETIPSLYETDPDYKFASKKATEKLKAENKVKKDAVSSLYVNGLKVIKEGTVIGRTLTDRELIVDYRNENYEDYRKTTSSTPTDTETEQEGDKVAGNYLRIIMNNLDKTVVENVEDYMKLDEGEPKKQVDHFSVVGTVLSKDDWVDKALAYTETHGDSTFKSRANLEEFYDICVGKKVNPEFIFVRGIQESGLSAANGNNYWGYNTPNGSSLWDGGTWQNVLNLYCDTILEYQDPTSGYYDMIMQRYEERSACTENGGIDPYGYGLPSSVSGIQSIYSWLGDDHSANDAGAGGMYYLYPWGWGGNQYEGENKIIFESKQEFEQLCGRKHNTSGGKTSSAKTTVWEQGMYTAWQSRKIIEPAKEIFGELAGTHDP